MKRIVMLVHECESPLEHREFFVSALDDAWERRGIVVVPAFGTATAVDGDAVINHVDLTKTPRAYRRYLQRYPVVINGRLLDISKRAFSSNLLTRDDSYEGKVIVKTAVNAGGRHELELEAGSSFVGRVRWKVAWTRTRREGTELGSGTHYFDGGRYPIFDSLDAVPRGVWRNPRLVVEKFSSERDGDHFVMRCWYFLGSSGFTMRALAAQPVVKGSDILLREVTEEPVPAEVRAVREALGADYGRIDYAVVDGVPIVYDVNRTPSTSPAARQFYRDQLVEIAQGIDDFV